MLLGFVLVLIGQIPGLPSSKPISPGNFGAEVRQYVLENLFSIVFCIVALMVGFIIDIYGLALRRNISSLKIDSGTAIMLGLFIMVSSIWVLTDSKTLAVFTTDYGGTLDKNTIVFISYVSFMLLPIIFISFLQHIIPTGNTLRVIEGLFILNLSTFVVLIIFNLSKDFYFLLLMIHHALLYILLIVGTVFCIRNFRHSEDKQERLLLRCVLLFMLFGGAALAVFLFDFRRLYVIIYGVGFVILIWYMSQLTLHKILSAYNQSVKAELYKSMAYTDILTDIKNRNAFITEQYDRPVKKTTCCIIMDINKLNWVNDTLGHSYGDELIRRSAKVVHDSFSDIGVCYRIGGDEFAVVCQDTDESSVKNTLEKMNYLIAAANSGSEPAISLACSYAFGSNDTDKFMDLFHRADKNMYFDKKRSDHIRD